MNWQTRIRVLAYSSPSGKRIESQFTDVSMSFDKQTSAYVFPALKGTYVQDLGPSGDKFPLRFYFSGDDHDLQADEFLAMLRESGPGVLEHPMYGVRNVVPFGTVERRDDLVSAANQSVFDVQLWETLLIAFPSSQIDPAKAVLNSVSKFNSAIAGQYSKQASIVTAIERVGLSTKFRNVLQSTRAAMLAVTTPRNEIAREFNSIYDSMNRTLDLFASNPLDIGGLETLAFQATLFTQTSAQSVRNSDGTRTDGREQVNAYKSIVDEVIEGPAYVDNGTTGPQNNFITDDLFVLNAVTGSVLSLVNAQFDTRPQAVTAADELLTLVQSVIDWRDSNYYELNMLDIGDAYQQFIDMVSLLAGFLVQISFSLRQEYSFVLDRNRTIIDLVAEIYGAVDEFLDFFILTNNLTGSEILELPRGRKILYYL